MTWKTETIPVSLHSCSEILKNFNPFQVLQTQFTAAYTIEKQNQLKILSYTINELKTLYIKTKVPERFVPFPKQKGLTSGAS